MAGFKDKAKNKSCLKSNLLLIRDLDLLKAEIFK